MSYLRRCGYHMSRELERRNEKRDNYEKILFSWEPRVVWAIRECRSQFKYSHRSLCRNAFWIIKFTGCCDSIAAWWITRNKHSLNSLSSLNTTSVRARSSKGYYLDFPEGYLKFHYAGNLRHSTQMSLTSTFMTFMWWSHIHRCEKVGGVYWNIWARRPYWGRISTSAIYLLFPSTWHTCFKIKSISINQSINLISRHVKKKVWQL